MHKEISTVEKSILGFILIVTLFSIAMKYINNDIFVSIIATEDGVIEWLTVVGLALTSIACFRRVILLKSEKSMLFLFMTALLGLVFLFGAGEEISWGQRIFIADCLWQRAFEFGLDLGGVKIYRGTRCQNC